MKIEKLITLSAERLQKDNYYLELIQQQNRESEIIKKISEFEKNIERLKKNTTYENRYINFSKIDIYEIKIEELQRELYSLREYVPSVAFCDCVWYVNNFNTYIQLCELLGIIDVLADPNYANKLSTYAEEIGIPELKDNSFVKDFQHAINTEYDIKQNSIDSKDFGYIDTNIFDEYTCEEADLDFVNDTIKDKVTNIIIKYIKRIILIAKMTRENYDYLNKEYQTACEILCENHHHNIYDDMIEQYGEELGHQVLMSLVQNDFYTQVSPTYVLAATVEHEGILVEKTAEGTCIRDPKMILASIIKTHNEEPFEDEFDEEEIDDNIYLSTFTEDEMSKEEKIEVAAHYSKELLNPNYRMTPEEIEQIINMGPKL